MKKEPVVAESKVVDLTRLLDGLNFTVESAVEAALVGATLFEQAAQYRVSKMRLTLVAEMYLEQQSAAKELHIRKEAADAGEKITENNIKAQLITDLFIANAQTRLNSAKADEEYAKLLVEAYRMRRDCLKAMIDLTGAERALQSMSSSNEQMLAATRKKLTEKYPAGR